MLTDVNLVICFPVSTSHTHILDTNNTHTYTHKGSFPKRIDVTSQYLGFFLKGEGVNPPNGFKDIKSFPTL